MKLDNIHKVYLIGIGGIGMSGLARYFKRRGCIVEGYDKTRTELTKELELEKIHITYSDDVSEITQDFLVHDPGTLVIYTPAVPKDSEIFNFFSVNDFILRKRSQVLGIISESSFTIAVAGTHGKTTTSTIIAHVLKHSGYDCSAFLGGISTNYHSNVLFGENNVLVVEADEFDRSFLTLHPDIAVITSMDPDHLDIYGDKKHLEESFRLFASQVKSGGKLIYKHSLPLNKKGMTYGLNSTSSDFTAHNIRIENGEYVFDFKSKEKEINDLQLGLPGIHNVENAAAAIVVALELKIPEDKIRAALASFAGVRRRFEYIVKNDKNIFIDDYAHHPEELRACISSVKQIYPKRKLTAIFQPHLYTRTRDFADGFAEVLSQVDELILLDIYPARELPISGVDSEMLFKKIKLDKKVLTTKLNLMEELKHRDLDVVLTVGAGDIDTMVQPIKDFLTK
jgi:UDP-N-acetylmuramate--alanine ligase